MEGPSLPPSAPTATGAPTSSKLRITPKAKWAGSSPAPFRAIRPVVRRTIQTAVAQWYFAVVGTLAFPAAPLRLSLICDRVPPTQNAIAPPALYSSLVPQRAASFLPPARRHPPAKPPCPANTEFPACPASVRLLVSAKQALAEISPVASMHFQIDRRPYRFEDRRISIVTCSSFFGTCENPRHWPNSPGES